MTTRVVHHCFPQLRDTFRPRAAATLIPNECFVSAEERQLCAEDLLNDDISGGGGTATTVVGAAADVDEKRNLKQRPSGAGFKTTELPYTSTSFVRRCDVENISRRVGFR